MEGNCMEGNWMGRNWMEGIGWDMRGNLYRLRGYSSLLRSSIGIGV